MCEWMYYKADHRGVVRGSGGASTPGLRPTRELEPYRQLPIGSTHAMFNGTAYGVQCVCHSVLAGV
jgi:hypothetical protein